MQAGGRKREWGGGGGGRGGSGGAEEGRRGWGGAGFWGAWGGGGGLEGAAVGEAVCCGKDQGAETRRRHGGRAAALLAVAGVTAAAAAAAVVAAAVAARLLHCAASVCCDRTKVALCALGARCCREVLWGVLCLPLRLPAAVLSPLMAGARRAAARHRRGCDQRQHDERPPSRPARSSTTRSKNHARGGRLRGLP